MRAMSLEVRSLGSRLSSGGSRGQVLEPRGGWEWGAEAVSHLLPFQHTCDLAPGAKPPSSRDNFSNRSGTQ